MRRREFITLVGASAAWPFAAEAQLKVHRVALVFSTAPVAEMAGPEPVNPYAKVFVRALHALGYVEGQNLVLYRRSAEGQFSRYRDSRCHRPAAPTSRMNTNLLRCMSQQMCRFSNAGG
jgi:hypothetical protein